MKIQRFEGENTREALAKVQQALGEDAVILQTRSIRIPGVLRRQRVEVLAAVEVAQAAAPTPTPSAATAPNASGKEGLEMTVVREKAGPPLTRNSALPPADWQSEMSLLRRELGLLRTEISQNMRRPVPKSDEWADDPAMGRNALIERLHSDLVTSSIQLRKGAPTTVCLVGPTGVGKTTTLAKLAAAASRHERKRIAMITIDTYRIGALEQLEAYARLLEVPLTKIYAPEDIRAAYDRYANYDLLFIDTIGRSSFNTQQIGEQAELLEALGANEVHLCLDSGASPATLRRCLDGFSLFQPTHLLLTKVDESASLGVSVKIALDSGLPLSYITTGQRVPEDLVLASAEDLGERLLLSEE